MQRLWPLLVASTVAIAGCGDDTEPVDIGSAETCEELADGAVSLLQDELDALQGMSMEDLADEDTPGVDDFNEGGASIEARAAELGCSDDLLCERFDQLEADGPAAEFIVDGLQSECPGT